MNPNTNTNPTDSQGSTASASTAASGSPLQRGKACLPCRRRKMKCDSTRPVCTPCLRAERAEDCEYTDGSQRPRTLTLEEDNARLRARLQELEHPETAVPSVQLYAPYAGAGSSTMVGAPMSMGQARTQAPPSSSYQHAVGMRPTLSHGPPRGGVTEPHRMNIEADIHLHARRALSVVAPHAAELGFFLNLDRLRFQGTQVLPALQSALTLWSVHITSASDPDHAAVRERTRTLASTLLSQAQTEIASALSTVDAEPGSSVFLHLIQAAVLLAYYMQQIGQIVGARYYASGTWAMVTMLRLYQRPDLTAGTREGEGQTPQGGGARGGLTAENTDTEAGARVVEFATCAKLPLPLDGIEAEERVRAFWAVYALDRWCGVVCEVPCQSLPLEGCVGKVMTVPWPGAGGMGEARFNVVKHLLNDPNHDFAREGTSAMHAKASVLLGEVAGLAASFVADHTISQSPAFRARFGTLDTLLRQCLTVAATVATASHGRQSRTLEQAQALMTVHLVGLAHITLHRPFITTYGPSRQRSVDGALGVVRVLDQLGEMGVAVGVISPVYAVVWTALCIALHEEVLRRRARPEADPSRRCEDGEMMAAIRKLVGVLGTLSQRCPGRFFAANIEAVLPILGSIAA